MHVRIQICLTVKKFFLIFHHPCLLLLVSCHTSNSEIGHGTMAALTLSWRTQLLLYMCVRERDNTAAEGSQTRLEPHNMRTWEPDPPDSLCSKKCKGLQQNSNLALLQRRTGKFSGHIATGQHNSAKSSESCLSGTFENSWGGEKVLYKLEITWSMKCAMKSMRQRQTICWRSASTESQRKRDWLQSGLGAFNGASSSYFNW